ncbi:trypsin-like peptidase domain-containing protein [Micromonospora sp. DT62]|uniref:VMAP-C domain-containing protein n=1 Tax=Micromonospora sp. DT62 TaxID=3416521 RepID=UPI003CF0A59F
MNASPQWHARIDVADGSGRGGSGFLIDPRHVLTCAHVVGDASRAEVLFPRAGKLRLDGDVVFRGPWRRGENDKGDVAVIRLTHSVERVKPAQLAPWNAVEIHAGRELGAIGFPDAYRETGQIAHFTAVAHPRLANDCCQTNANGSTGPRLLPGYSGSAAYLPGSYQVVGMVIAADRDPGMRTGVLLPLDEIGRHWPDLLERISLGPFDSNAYRDLHEILNDLSMPDARQLLLEVLRPRTYYPDPPAGLSNALAAVEWLAVDTTFPEEDVVDLLNALLRRIGRKVPERAAALRKWFREHGVDAGTAAGLPEPTDAGTAAAQSEPSGADTAAAQPESPDADVRPGWVVVRIAPTADPSRAHQVTIWTATDPDGALDRRIVEETVAEDAIRATVERALPMAYREIPEATYDSITVEFVLPRGRLAWPVDTWQALDDLDQVPLGWNRPVVVRALEWFDGAHDSARLKERANRLRTGTRRLDETLEWRHCGSRKQTPTQFQAWLRESTRRDVLGLAGPWATPERIGSAVASGLPVLLWRRSACGVHPEADELRPRDPCPGLQFRDAMAKELDRVHSNELPRLIRELRAAAGGVDDGQEHCGRDVTLLWDGPQRRPPQLTLAE